MVAWKGPSLGAGRSRTLATGWGFLRAFRTVIRERPSSRAIRRIDWPSRQALLMAPPPLGGGLGTLPSLWPGRRHQGPTAPTARRPATERTACYRPRSRADLERPASNFGRFAHVGNFSHGGMTKLKEI